MKSAFGWLIFLLLVFPGELGRNVIEYDPPPDEVNPQYFLPSEIRPDRYEVTISSNLEDSTPFYEGDVLIKVQLLDKDCKPTGKYLTIANKDEIIANRLKLSLKTPLVEDRDYEIAIKFSRNMLTTHQAGYVLRSYRKGRVTKFMAFTTGNEFDIRQVIPCFDQLHMKAKFKLWHEHPKTSVAFSSARFQVGHEIPDRPEWIKDEYYEIENMPTFSFAIALMAEFQSTGFFLQSNVNLQTWGTKTTVPRVHRINSMASRIFAFFSEFFKMPLPLGKLDVLILPEVDFLIQESETYVLDILEKDSTPATIEMLSKMCHAVSYQWIGNTVTMFKWQDNWWHQGLNSFLQTVCVENLFKEYPSNIFELNLVESFTKLLRNEETHEYEPISILKSYPDYHPEKNLTEERLYHFIRMMHFILGPKVFRTRLAKYLATHQKKNAHFIEALAAFSDPPNTDEPIILPETRTMRAIMESWLNERVTPLIRVNINRTTKTATVTQEIFDRLDANTQESDRKKHFWIIPLSYTTKKELKFNEITPRVWSVDAEPVFFSTGELDQHDWVLVNLELNVPGRVMYEPENWILIQESLLDQDEYKKISVLTRVRVLSDMFSLAEAGILSYKIVFKTIEYLKHEEEFAVWHVAFKEIDKLRLLLLRTNLFEAYQALVRTILEHVFGKRNFISFQEVKKGNEIESNFEVSLMEFSCKFGVPGCNLKCSSLYDFWLRANGLGKILNMRHSIYKIVLCEHIKDGDKQFFDEFWKSPSEMRIPGSTEDLLEVFACSQKKDILERLLKKSINNAIISPKESIQIFKFLSSNNNGYALMMTFFLKNYRQIKKFHSGENTSLLPYLQILLDVTNNNEDLTKLSNFAIEKGLVMSDKDTRKSLKNAIRNTDWANRNTKNLAQVFNDMNQ